MVSKVTLVLALGFAQAEQYGTETDSSWGTSKNQQSIRNSINFENGWVFRLSVGINIDIGFTWYWDEEY